MRARAAVEVVVHRGKFTKSTPGQMPPVWTSRSGLFGAMSVVMPAAPPHQVNPRRSFVPFPWITSATHMVLLVPSVMSPIARGRPILPRSGLTVHGFGASSTRLEPSYQPNGAPPNIRQPELPSIVGFVHPIGTFT